MTVISSVRLCIVDPDRPMSEDELEEVQRRLSLLSKDHVRAAFRAAWEECRMNGDLLPTARAIQQLVPAWKLVWRWRR